MHCIILPFVVRCGPYHSNLFQIEYILAFNSKSPEWIHLLLNKSFICQPRQYVEHYEMLSILQILLFQGESVIGFTLLQSALSASCWFAPDGDYNEEQLTICTKRICYANYTLKSTRSAGTVSVSTAAKPITITNSHYIHILIQIKIHS